MYRQVFYTLLTRSSSTALNFLIALLVARHGGPSVKGEVTLLVTTVWFIIFISNLLGGPVLIYLLPRHRLSRLLPPAYIWCLLVALAGYVLLRVMPLIPVEYAAPVTAMGLLSSVTSLHQSALYAQKRIQIANLLQVLPLIILAGVLGVLYYVLPADKVKAYIYGYTAGYLFASILSCLYLFREIKLIPDEAKSIPEELPLLLRQGLIFQLTEVLQLLNLRYYFFQLGNQQGMAYLGIYSVGISVLEAVWLIPRSIYTVNYVDISHQTNLRSAYQQTTRFLQVNFFWCAVVLAALYVVPSVAYVKVFGSGFAEVRHAIRFLFPGIWIYSGWWVMFSYYCGVGRYWPLIISSAFGSMALIALSAYLLPRYVMSGAGLAATLSFAVATAVLGWYYLREGRGLVS
ncbi:MAG: hypothetical protein NZM35_02475 [Chitinophagales bacterium]|nr:hypothetical protein [Chitinophagales bacterium]MDW8417927.1 hypothetical protein [Chitinophagales bacterium]